MENRVLFRDFVHTAFANGDYATDDVIAFLLPVFKEVLSFHEGGNVAPFRTEEVLYVTDGLLDIDETLAHKPLRAPEKLQPLFEQERSSNFDVVGRVKMDTDIDRGTSLQDLRVHFDSSEPFSTPVYLRGYTSFEIFSGHHDEQTDIFCLGLILGSVALGLDLYDEEDLTTFVTYRTNPAYYNTAIHPSLSTLITQMTELDRSKRSQDLYDVIQRLENYRDFDPEKQVDLTTVAGWKTKQISNKGQFILSKLRNRLFDISRRNRLLYYKPNMRFVNLTVSSVPMVLHHQSIRPELLFTWNADISGKVKEMKEIVLNKYLRFDDHRYLSASFDKIRVEAQHDIQEYGFSQLKLVIAFLNWHNLKEDKDERIQTPLLLIPVELKKNKKLKEDHYVLKVLTNEAEVNPIIVNQLHELYGIKLPDLIALDDTTLEAFYQKLKEQIDHANQGIVLHYIDKPKIKLIHSVAKQTVTNYKRRLRKGGNKLDSYKNIDYSYQPEHYKPLGLEIFKDRIEPRATMLEFLINDDIKVESHQLIAKKERELYQLVDSESNPYSWDFDVCNIVLGNFNYKKMSLVRDYNQVIDKNVHHEVFEKLFSDKPKQYSDHNHDLSAADSWHHVIAADPTQTRAILEAREGESYIIQGPPGTGKSQTITNLIADFVAQGKRILFVCEKRAALDVVYHRLKQQGLDELCCYIHDSQSDKREFIRNLKATYESFIKNKLDLKQITDERSSLLHKMSSNLADLREYHLINSSRSELAGLEVRKLIERLIQLKRHIISVPVTEEELLPHYNQWKEFGETVCQLSSALEETGAEPWFSEHPFSKLQDQLFLSDTPAIEISKLVTDAGQLLQQVIAACRDFGVDGEHWDELHELKELVEDSALLHPLAISSNIGLIDPKNPDAAKFDRSYAAYKQFELEVNEAEEKVAGWRDKLSEEDAHAAVPVALAHEGSFFGFLSGSWRRLKKRMNMTYDFSIHNVKPKYSTVLHNLLDVYSKQKKFADAEKDLQKEYKFDDLKQARAGIEQIRAKIGDKEVDYLLSHHDPDNLVKKLYSLHPMFSKLENCLKNLFHKLSGKTISTLQDDLDNIQANLGLLKDLLPVLKSYAQTSPQMKDALRQLSLQPECFEATMANKTLKEIYQNKRDFATCDGAKIQARVLEIQHCYNQLLKINASFIRAAVRERFLTNLDMSALAVSQLQPDQRSFKKSYTEGRKILENEFSKSMRYKSIRELAERESGLVLRDLKPVWLMSPLSVSDSLPVEGKYFNVVIFDEASQITLEEGIPSLYRAPQTIIVGDDKQMPPTNFFSAKAEDPDDLEKFSTDDDDDVLSNDADSLLVQGSRKLNSVMLCWHYRSRYETLISYSNHAFYGAGLLTIPDRTVHEKERQLIEVSSHDQAPAFADALFDRSLSFHFHSNAVYEKRSNADEANYIAFLVRELLKRKVKESIGIVAFSQEQQHTIEDALNLLAGEDKEFEQLLEQAYTRTEDDQYVGLIVKNLENIQGDERDIIVMSVCYGPDAKKKMIMNFGPINKKGGEKRLNVIFSRAKKHMAVVSSIKHHQITNEYNEGANYFKRFLHYAEQVSSGNMEMARIILDSLVQRKDRHRSSEKSLVQEELKAALEKEGYFVDENIGQSGFKCSLGIKNTRDDDDYQLSVLVDDDNHYSNKNLLEQYCQRPEILKNFGWNTMSVFTKDWFHFPENVITQIKRKMTDDASETTNMSHVIIDEPTSAIAPMQDNSELATAAGQYDHLEYTRVTFSEGSSNKFWEAAVDGQRLVVRFGRIGTKGQTQIKSFATPEAAMAEKEKVVKEKISKGYIKV